jgi:hypothetical protein
MTNIWYDRSRGLEEAYVRRKDHEALEALRRRLAADKLEHKTNVSLRCPTCGGALAEIRLVRGIVVDRCTNCQGVWLEPWQVERLDAEANQK